jgi:hypothetical protein
MPSIRCQNGHTHDSVQAVRECVNQPGPATDHDKRTQVTVRLATEKQLKFIGDLGGDVHHAADLSIAEASAYIAELKAQRAAVASEAKRHNASLRAGSLAYTDESNPVHQMLALVDAVPDGYYAVRADDEAPIRFLRLSTGKRDQYKGWRKVQTIHGPNLDIAWTRRPDGSMRSYKSGIEDDLLLLIANYQAAALRYAKEIGKCARCNTRLTSEWRKVGVGPECVKMPGWGFALNEREES